VPTYRGIHHLALATGSLDRTIRFWRDLVGLPVVARLGAPGYRQYFFAIGPRDLLAFFEWPGVEPVPEKDHGSPTRGPFAFDHVALEVDDDEALWELRDRIAAAGIWVSDLIDHGFMRSLYTFDPNGVPVEFTRGIPGCDVREQPLLADREPGTVAREGTAPRPEAWPAPAAPTPAAERRVYPGAGSELFHGKKRV
jgi:catechol 2,3-dioxygenase-like lactoylglutathione lyase family enzyme